MLGFFLICDFTHKTEVGQTKIKGKTMIKTVTKKTVDSTVVPVTDPIVRIIEVTPMELALALVGLQGSQFLSATSAIDMLVVNAKGQLTKMNKTGNPFLGKTLVKKTTQQATVNFNYQKKRQARSGDAPEHNGNWQTAVVINGKPTPLSTHKDDVKTKLTDDTTTAYLNDDGSIKDCIANHRAVFNSAGDIQFVTNNPRLYLRYETVRDGGGELRNDRKMRLQSVYVDAYGNEVAKSDVEPWLKSRKPRTDETDVQTLNLGNVSELRIGGIVYVIR